jgi:hypothetical protein
MHGWNYEGPVSLKTQFDAECGTEIGFSKMSVRG